MIQCIGSGSPPAVLFIRPVKVHAVQVCLQDEALPLKVHFLPGRVAEVQLEAARD